MNFKKVAALILSASLLTGLVGCGSSTTNTDTSQKKETKQTVENSAFKDAEKKLMDSLAPLPKPIKQYKLAALEITLANPFWVTVKEGYEDAAKEYKVSCDIMAAPKEDDVNSQLETFKTLIGKDYDGISISSITPFNLIPGVAEANKKKIPVVAVGTSIDDKKGKEANAKVQAFITSNFEDQGKVGGEFIVNKINSGKVAIIEGMAGAAQSEARKNGAKKAFEANKNIRIVSVQAGNWDRKKAYDIATNLIQANPDLKGIFCANDMMALGVVDALKAANKKDQVAVVGVDFIDEAKKSIENKELDATVAMSPYLFGKGGLILALKVLEGQEINKDIYWTPIAVVNNENVKTFDGWK
ncbi:substrate-binding domain-containing protein [Clostridium sporogenes]